MECIFISTSTVFLLVVWVLVVLFFLVFFFTDSRNGKFISVWLAG